METYNIQVKRTARYYTSGELNENTDQVIFLLHGYGQSAASLMKSVENYAPKNTYLVAPEGLSRFYWEQFSGQVVASWMTSEDRENEIDDYVGYLDCLYKQIIPSGVVPPKVICFGFSQGVATASRWINRSKYKFDLMINYAGRPAHDVDWSDMNNPVTSIRHFFIVGDNDQWIDENTSKQIGEIYTKNNLRCHFIKFEGKHEILPQTLIEVFKKIKDDIQQE